MSKPHSQDSSQISFYLTAPLLLFSFFLQGCEITSGEGLGTRLDMEYITCLEAQCNTRLFQKFCIEFQEMLSLLMWSINLGSPARLIKLECFLKLVGFVVGHNKFMSYE